MLIPKRWKEIDEPYTHPRFGTYWMFAGYFLLDVHVWDLTETGNMVVIQRSVNKDPGRVFLSLGQYVTSAGGERLGRYFDMKLCRNIWIKVGEGHQMKKVVEKEESTG